jgi:hypothetical protein
MPTRQCQSCWTLFPLGTPRCPICLSVISVVHEKIPTTPAVTHHAVLPVPIQHYLFDIPPKPEADRWQVFWRWRRDHPPARRPEEGWNPEGENPWQAWSPFIDGRERHFATRRMAENSVARLRKYHPSRSWQIRASHWVVYPLTPRLSDFL